MNEIIVLSGGGGDHESVTEDFKITKKMLLMLYDNDQEIFKLNTCLHDQTMLQKRTCNCNCIHKEESTHSGGTKGEHGSICSPPPLDALSPLNLPQRKKLPKICNFQHFFDLPSCKKKKTKQTFSPSMPTPSPKKKKKKFWCCHWLLKSGDQTSNHWEAPTFCIVSEHWGHGGHKIQDPCVIINELDTHSNDSKLRVSHAV